MVAATVDEYIETFSPEIQKVLKAVRATVRAAAPDAEERISYRMPAVFQGGAVVYFAAFKKHIGLFPPVADPKVRAKVAAYAGPKGNLQFPYDEPIPHKLIALVVAARLKANLARNAERGKPSASGVRRSRSASSAPAASRVLVRTAVPARSSRAALMAEPKTRPTDASVAGYLAAIEDDARRTDCEAIAKLMRKVTKQEPRMWGTSIVGFGAYRYTYESGRTGESCQTGFSSRKGDISVYLVASGPGQEVLLAQLGKHKMGKACLYIRRLSDIDVKVLEQLVSGSVAEVKRRYGQAASGA